MNAVTNCDLDEIAISKALPETETQLDDFKMMVFTDQSKFSLHRRALKMTMEGTEVN